MDDKILERLEAEAKVADASPEELTVAVESDIESKEEQVEELERELQEKESTVEELEAQVSEKEERLEELQEEVDQVAEMYSENIAESSPALEAEELQERYDVAELREKHETLKEEEAEPNPSGGDPGPAVQSPEEESGEGEPDEVDELAEQERVAADAFEQRAQKTGKDYWKDIADDIRGE